MNAIFPSSSFQVRQLAQYGRTDAAIPGTVTLMQMGEAGAPYASILTSNLVSSALAAGGDLNLLAGLSEIVFGFDQGAGAVVLSVVQGELQVSPSLRTSRVDAAFVDAASVTVNGSPVVTQAQLAAIPSVTSFNQRTGDVLLEDVDILRAGGAPIRDAHFGGWITAPTIWDTRTADDTVATTCWVHRLLCDGAVTSFNGRTGNVTLTTADVNAAYSVPGTYPMAPSPVLGDASDRIATTSFVDESLDGFAPVYSPSFTGRPTAATQPFGDNSTALATTAFVTAASGVGTYLPLAGGTMTGSLNMAAGKFYQYNGKNLAYVVPNATADNVFFGEAGNATLTGYWNAGIGPAALAAATSGNSNIAVGGSALTAVTTGGSNIGIGTLAGGGVTTGSNNTIIGYNCGGGLTTGGGNTVIGYGLTGLPTALANTLVLGAGAAILSTVSSTNTFHGSNSGNLSLTGTQNTAAGYFSSHALTTGTLNVSVGSSALGAETTGSGNVALGKSALGTQNGASNNISIGNTSGPNITTGGGNIFIGANSGTNVTTGSNNIILGNPTLSAATSTCFAYAFGGVTKQDWNLTTANTHTFAGGPVVVPQVVTTPVNVSALPAASAALTGARAFVNDATATTFLSVVAGTGSNKVPVVCNGTNWLIG